METPNAYYAVTDRGSARSIFLLEDVGVSRGATFTDPSTYINRAQAESMVGNVAAYHGAFWESPKLRSLRWLPTSLAFQ